MVWECTLSLDGNDRSPISRFNGRGEGIMFGVTFGKWNFRLLYCGEWEENSDGGEGMTEGLPGVIERFVWA